MRHVIEIFLAFVLAAFTVFQLAKSAPVDSKLVSLYGPLDNVTILTGLNFNTTVFNSRFIWMVEFYASWCGHCQEFAPTFKVFAKDTAEWEQAFRLAVINCPDDLNHQVCTNMDVRAFPNMRIFPPFSNEEKTGIKVNGHTIENLRNLSVHYIGQYIDKVTWDLPGTLRPMFTFILYDDIIDFLIMADKGPYYLAVIIEASTSNMGKEIILDVSSCKNITARRFDSASPEIKKVSEYTGISFRELPSVVVFMKGGKSFEVDVKMRIRSFYSYKLRSLPGVGEPKVLPKQAFDTGLNITKTYANWMEVDRSKVYLADIESGLRYSLTVEVGSTKILEGESLEAAKEFVGTLALLSEHLPLSKSTKNFLTRLTGWLAGKNIIDFKTWERRMNSVEPGSYLPRIDQRWVGCAPSKPGLRGYPCSLWTLFHTLTVAAYNKNEHGEEGEDVQAVLKTMESYISNFFGCMECRKNFIRELFISPYDNIESTDDSIIWLWELHNKVNKRLHGAVSEDQNIPKVQFPSPEFCPKCREPNGLWNRETVLKYLVELYSADKVLKNFMDQKDVSIIPDKEYGADGNDLAVNLFDQDYGIDFEINARLKDSDFDAGDGNYEIPKEAPAGSNQDPHLIYELRKDREKDGSIHIMKQLGDKDLQRRITEIEREWQNPDAEPVLTSIDASVCFVLWGTSLIVVIILYMYMRRRNRIKNCIL